MQKRQTDTHITDRKARLLAETQSKVLSQFEVMGYQNLNLEQQSNS